MPRKPARRRNQFRADKEVRRLARERIGTAPPARVIQPKSRKRPKHPKREEEQWIES